MARCISLPASKGEFIGPSVRASVVAATLKAVKVTYGYSCDCLFVCLLIMYLFVVCLKH